MHRDMVAVELRSAVREDRRRVELAHQRIEHVDELIALDVVDAPAAVVHQHAQLAAEDLGGARGLGTARVEIGRHGHHGHHYARAVAREARQRAADRKLQVVRVRADGEHGLAEVAREKREAAVMQLFCEGRVHGEASRGFAGRS
jgi:hypothetical protein